MSGAGNQMINIEHILCPVDLTLNSDKALRYAAALARAYGSKLFVCHCAKELAPRGTVAHLEERQEIKRAIKRSYDLSVGDDYTLALDWESIVVEDHNPAEGITREARERGVDLIVMCSRRRPVAAALLGSTAESVYRTAPCPVLVTHPDQREWVDDSTGTADLKRVLVAHDFSDYSELALRYALSTAQEYQAEVHLLHVLPPPVFSEPEIAWAPSTVEGTYHEAARGLQQAVPGEAYLWCTVKTAVRWGKPYREILSYARENEIDLIYMGAHGNGFEMQALFGSNVDRVIRQSACPVLVARPLKGSSVLAGSQAEAALGNMS